MKTWNEWPIDKVSLGEKNYPKILSQIKNPPQALYFRGNLDEKLFNLSIAVVGSRRATQYGKTVTEKLVAELVIQKATIISGFMYGIDTYAHKMAVDYGGKTIAVFGCGLDVCYPAENEILYSEILAKGGGVVSEYEPKAKPHLWKFPQRNRIVIGLSSIGVLVVEAGEASGSLVTARIARKERKKVFAIPGPITSSSSIGTNWLIKEGMAKMVLGIEDIIQMKESKVRSSKAGVKLDGIEEEIYKILKSEPLTIDELVKTTQKGVSQISQAITIMSMKGLISEVGGKLFVN